MIVTPTTGTQSYTLSDLPSDQVPLRRVAVVAPDSNSYVDEYAYMATVPTSVFYHDDMQYISPLIYGDGSQTRDFIYIDDLVDAIVKASEFVRGGEVFQIASGTELTLNELVEELKPIFEQEAGQKMQIKHGETRLGDVLRNYSDTRKAQNVLGWKITTPLHQGLINTVKDLMVSI